MKSVKKRKFVDRLTRLKNQNSGIVLDEESEKRE
jgi:hypothetical protein